ncbi:MAG: pyridoxamine 5'-phosphate oxidase family protein [Nocardioides sp.]|nr:pyridoxamine 5'-phosphate oxidase family protein [Nocardioides sp.]
MSGRDAVRMDEAELEDFLRANTKVQVATIQRDGAAHLTTLFYDLLESNRIAFWTYGRSQKIRNLERDPRITCLVEDGTDYFELRGASIKGTAEIVRDQDRLLEIGTAVAMRMVGVKRSDELGEIGIGEVRRQAQKRVAVIVTPDRISTWDHRKMSGPERKEQHDEGQG